MARLTLSLVLLLAASPFAASAAEYEPGLEHARSRYRAAVARCEQLPEKVREGCIGDARARLAQTEASARAKRGETPEARAAGRREAADLRFRAASARCESYAGRTRDACLERARADRKRSRE